MNYGLEVKRTIKAHGGSFNVSPLGLVCHCLWLPGNGVMKRILDSESEGVASTAVSLLFRCVSWACHLTPLSFFFFIYVMEIKPLRHLPPKRHRSNEEMDLKSTDKL